MKVKPHPNENEQLKISDIMKEMAEDRKARERHIETQLEATQLEAQRRYYEEQREFERKLQEERRVLKKKEVEDRMKREKENAEIQKNLEREERYRKQEMELRLAQFQVEFLQQNRR